MLSLRSIANLRSWATTNWQRGARIFDSALSAALILALATPVWRFLSTLPQRLSYPWELEWMEGGIVSHIRVLLAGEPLYRAPSLTFTPFIYPPFYYYVSALVAKVVGLGYFAPRLVSVVSIVGCFALLFFWVWRETRSRLAACVAMGLFAATYDLSGRWFDIARGDSLLLLLLLLACSYGRFGRGVRSCVATGVLLTLAFFTKQTALIIALPILLALILRLPRHGWIASATFLACVALGVAVFDRASAGWFWFYVFELPAQHAVQWGAWRQALFAPIWPWVAPMAIASVAVICGLPLLRGGFRAWPASGLFVACACAGSAAALLHSGGYVNVLMPALAAMAIASALCVARARETEGPLRMRLRVFAAAIVLLQLGLLSFGESAARLRAGDREVGARLIGLLATMPAPIWCTSSNYYPVLAGHPEQLTHTMGLVDVFRGRNQALQRQLLSELQRDLASGRVRTIVLDRAAGFLPDSVVAMIHANYRLNTHLMPPNNVPTFWPNTGAEVRPDEVWSFAPRARQSAAERP
jgi:Dolichyl-phosphate-mannose-protein mannosyltransferase